LDFVDVKIGRQVLTWGTGDLLFVNDLFPKDWKSFFCGRDTEYLKAFSDAAKISVFFDLVNIDLVYMPLFNGSDYIDGDRLFYWNPLLGRTAGRDYIFHDEDRDAFFNEDEWAVRLYRICFLCNQQKIRNFFLTMWYIFASLYKDVCR